MADEPMALLCLAHLNWDHVWQRPQQVMTRMAERYRVIYIDPPEVAGAAAPTLRDLGVQQGVQVYRPIFPLAQAGHPTAYWQLWHAMLPEVLALAGANSVLWVFSPFADTLVERARSQVRLVVYDCMDDLASFKDGTPEHREREVRLMAVADLVFTGGHSMYEARKGKHPRVHCFPSGVDVAHYRRGREEGPPPEHPIAMLPHPLLGYFGVLDERIDWALIAALAARRPDWHWALVGPTAKVDPVELPRATNIHYLGKQPYADLPGILQHFDIATMPFALNAATRYISPTKTPEYLAGGKWVLSSSVNDVIATYGESVVIADGVQAWAAAIERILQASPAELERRLERARPILEGATWDATVDSMVGLIEAQLA